MRPLTIFRHIACEGPAYLAEVLDRLTIPWRLVRIDAGEPVPDSLADCSGLVFMGGPMSANDPLPWIEQELSLIRRARAQDMPVLGHCLGGQLICKALGGTVSANPVKEIGWHSVRKCPTPAAESWLAGLPDEATLFHWHGETFSIPDGAEVILESEFCPHQAFAIGNTLALQCHVEMLPPMVAEWAALYAHELQQPSTTVQTAEQMSADLPARIAAAQHVADSIYQHWLAPLLAESS
ncbi:MAG: type 1 glutamine amidotransferase [Gammaproteobacteria bacterium]|nr:type 1 glutamine amidotransferase [Gammaproteobacteria bacterium]